MESEQPYRPPEAEVGGPAAGDATYGGGGEPITPGMITMLTKTRPWVAFLGILGMIGCGLMVLAGLFMAVAGGVGSEFGPLGGIGIGLLYVVMALVYFVPSLYLVRYGSAIRQVDRAATGENIEAALKHQLAFWRLIGILTLIMMALYGIALIILVIAGIASVTGG